MYLLEFKLSMGAYESIYYVRRFIAANNWDIDLLLFEALSDPGDHYLVSYLVKEGANIHADKGFGKTAKEYGIKYGYNWQFLERDDEYDSSSEEDYDDGESCESVSIGDFEPNAELIGEADHDFILGFGVWYNEQEG